MPELPSGIKLGLSSGALFDHGGNWFKCPDGHFWYWVADPEMGAAPFDLDDQIMLVSRHAPVPKDRKEAKRYLRVLEFGDDGKLGWRGEWLAWFPRYTELDTRDLKAWNAWLNRPETDAFIDGLIEECQRLAEDSRHAKGYATYQVPKGTEPDAKGWIVGEHRNPRKQH